MKNYSLFLLFTIFIQSCSSLKNAAEPNIENLKNEEVYNNGYTQTTEKERTGAVDKVSAPKVVETLDLYLRKVAGVAVHGSGRTASITIRGMTSLNGSNDPLFLVDNNIVTGGFGAVYDFVNPNEIASLTVLKDASETGIYGAQGSNGVILIERKKKD
jgi:TonB-dependent starch-binding outer membrane protein SusC